VVLILVLVVVLLGVGWLWLRDSSLVAVQRVTVTDLAARVDPGLTHHRE